MRRAALSALVLSLVLAGCSSEPQAPKKAPTKVTYVTAYGAYGQEAFAWVARHKGYFAEAGLDVEIQLGAGTGKNLTLIESGRAQFAQIDMAGGLIAASTGHYMPFKFVMAVHQSTLLSYITTAGSGITSPKDLEGKNVAVVKGTVHELMLPGYAKLAGFDASKVHWVYMNTSQVPTALVSGRVPAIAAYSLRAADIKAAGKTPVVLSVSDFLGDLYGGGILARSDYIDRDPGIVRKFVGAMVRGLEYTIDHPDEAAQILHDNQPAVGVQTAADEIRASAPYCRPVGRLEWSRVTKGLAVLQSTGLIKPTAPEQIADFTMVPAA